MRTIFYEKRLPSRFILCVDKANPDYPLNYFAYQNIYEVKSTRGKR